MCEETNMDQKIVRLKIVNISFSRFPWCHGRPWQSVPGGAGPHGGDEVRRGQQARHGQREVGVQRAVHRHQLPSHHPPGVAPGRRQLLLQRRQWPRTRRQGGAYPGCPVWSPGMTRHSISTLSMSNSASVSVQLKPYLNEYVRRTFDKFKISSSNLQRIAMKTFKILKMFPRGSWPTFV